MDVKSVMTPDPAFCTRETPLQRVAELMLDNDCGAIPVVDDELSRHPVGVVTDRDITVRLVAEGRNPLEASAADCMSEPVTMVPRDATLADAAHLMETHKIRRVPVVDDDGALCGMVALADVALSGLASTTVDVVKEVSERE